MNIIEIEKKIINATKIYYHTKNININVPNNIVFINTNAPTGLISKFSQLTDEYIELIENYKVEHEKLQLYINKINNIKLNVDKFCSINCSLERCNKYRIYYKYNVKVLNKDIFKKIDELISIIKDIDNINKDN